MAAKMQSPEAQARYEAFQDASSRMRDLVRKQEQLTSSKTECEMVAGELSQLKAEEPVYKLMGKVLVLQDPADAKANVTQRLQMIDRELCVFWKGAGGGGLLHARLAWLACAQSAQQQHRVPHHTTPPLPLTACAAKSWTSSWRTSRRW